MQQKVTMTNFREFFQSRISNINWPSFNMMKSTGKIIVEITEPIAYDWSQEPYHATFKLFYDTITKLYQAVGKISTDKKPDMTPLDTMESLETMFNTFYAKLSSRVVSVNVHLEMDTCCMHGVEKDYL